MMVSLVIIAILLKFTLKASARFYFKISFVVTAFKSIEIENAAPLEIRIVVKL